MCTGWQTFNEHGAQRRAFTLGKLADEVNAEVVGDSTVVICGVSEVETAKHDDLVLAIDKRYAQMAFQSNAGAVLVPPELVNPAKPCLVSREPRLTFIRILELYAPQRWQPQGISLRASVHSTAKVAPDASIGEFTFVGPNSYIGAQTIIYPLVYIGANVTIGNECIVYPNVAIYDDVEIGDRVIIHAGAIIGRDGFGFAWDGSKYQRIPQLGKVVIEDDVEIGANSCIDRATLGVTRVGRGTKIDNLVQVAHNCDVGEHVLLCGMAGLAGSAVIGDRVTIGAQAGVRDHVKVGAGAIVAGRAAVAKDVPDGATVSGYPARPHREALRVEALTRQMPHWVKILKQLVKDVEALKARLKDGKEA